ncbi:MAG: SH3 domain-containing protein [Actinomycetota bacterium]
MGQAEVVVLLTFAAVIGLAFLWALVLHEKPVADRRPAAVDPTESTLVPPSLPAPRRYAVDDTGVNVRQGPATNTAALTRLEAGSTVTVICKTAGQDVSGDSGSTNLWVRLDLGELGVGYASALYVDTGDDIENPNRIGDCALAPAA